MNAAYLNGFLDGNYVDQDAPPAEVLLEWVRSGRVTEAMLTLPWEDTRVLLTADHRDGVSILIESAEHSRFACVTPLFQAPSVSVDMGPHREIWPAELFLPPQAAGAVLEHVIATGKESSKVAWVNADEFPRVSVDVGAG